ncbi:MAG: sterol desaturase family protein [Gammaproteobacteria bacterium]|nr:sterol desaturase family protein [Gammaproteobacteria bacterium]
MSSIPCNPTGKYQPEKTIGVPALYVWPPRPLAALKYLVFDMLFPWGYLYIGLAFVSWYYLTPPLAAMAEVHPGWIAQIWLRNAALLTLVAGGLYWWLYLRRGQGRKHKYHDKWPATGNKMFLWGNQVWDNVFWSIVSGVTICTAYEAFTFWIYANDFLILPTIAEHPVYFLVCVWGVFFWGFFHFYCVHRFMHWQPVYEIVHERHHRNVNTGPWTGISMHPFEHVLYFSVFIPFWFLPVHPVIIVLLSLFMSIGPAPSHSGFNFVEIKGMRFFAGDWFHQLHHQYFNFNYGNTPAPMDKLFGSWHDGSRDSLLAQKQRKRDRRRQAA